MKFEYDEYEDIYNIDFEDSITFTKKRDGINLQNIEKAKTKLSVNNITVIGLNSNKIKILFKLIKFVYFDKK